MHPTIKKHKTPIAVTTAGLLTAFGLAIAPVLMAESDIDKLAEQNSADIKKLIASVDGATVDVDERINSLSRTAQGQLDSLQNQIQTLNKATRQLHLRHQSMQKPSGAIRSSIDSLASSSNGRLINLEKAVTQLHKRQRENLLKASTSEIAAKPDNDNVIARIEKLEKALADLEKNQSEPSANNPTNQYQQQDLGWRVVTLERMVSQFVLNQNILDTAGGVKLEESIRKDVETDIHIKKLERSIEQLEMRIDNMDNLNNRSNRVNNQRYDPVANQLFEIQRSVETLLNDMGR